MRLRWLLPIGVMLLSSHSRVLGMGQSYDDGEERRRHPAERADDAYRGSSSAQSQSDWPGRPVDDREPLAAAGTPRASFPAESDGGSQQMGSEATSPPGTSSGRF